MLSAAFVYGLFVLGCISGLRRPWLGVVFFYVFVVLEPTWNWRWAIDRNFGYQKYIALCVLAGVLILKFKHVKIHGAPRWSLNCLLSFLGISYIAATQSISPVTSALYMDVLWKVILMTVLTVWLIDSPYKIWILMWVVVVCQGYNAYQINLQYFEEGFSRFARTNWGDKGDNNVYSIYTVPIMGMAAALTVYGRVWWQYLLAGSILVMQMHVLMLLESRGTMIGGLVLAIVFIAVVPKSFRICSTLAVSIICGVTLAGPSVVEEFSSAFKPQGELDPSAESRYDLWAAGAIITKQYPLLGVGPNAGRFLVPQYYPPERHRPDKALHNLFFEISTGCGIPAALFYVAFFGIVFLACLLLYLKSRRDLPDWAAAGCLAVVCGVPGYWAGSMFSSGALLESSYLLIGIGSATLLTYQREQEMELWDDMEPDTASIESEESV